MDFTETAYAKINLILHVCGRRDDGYHDLDTIFAFVNRGDEISAQVADDLQLQIAGPFADGLSVGGDNLVLKMANMLRARYNVTKGARLFLTKNLPVASGIGGGSADAAATARLLNRLWEIGASQDELEVLSAPLGADIPACIGSVTARGTGTGTALQAVDGQAVTDMPILLVNPRRPVATGSVFAAWAGLAGGDSGKPTVAGIACTLESICAGRNDLENPAISICPEIAEILSAVTTQAPLIARMSGSGATCFALFENNAGRDEAERNIRSAYSDYWTMAGNLR